VSVRRTVAFGIATSILAVACGAATPAAPAGVDLVSLRVRNVGAKPATVTVTAPALVPRVQGATLAEGSTVTFYLPSTGTWQFDIDGRAYATESRLESWKGCPLSVEVVGDGSIAWDCAES
jgi:hypothetical protein